MYRDMVHHGYNFALKTIHGRRFLPLRTLKAGKQMRFWAIHSKARLAP